MEGIFIMKKKLLSLVLAGAMVASTSVSAFAEDKVINAPETQDVQTNVSIQGRVANDTGDLPEGNFNITIPTTASFTVSQDGDVITMPITVKNNGEQNIEVYAVKFADTTATEGTNITVTKQSDLKSKNRSYVNLNLRGNLKTVYLKSEELNSNSTGIYQEATLTNKATTDEQLKLAVINGRNSGELTLEGKAGEDPTQTITDALTDNFTLTLKIKKSAK